MNSHPVWGVAKNQKDKIGSDHIGKYTKFTNPLHKCFFRIEQKRMTFNHDFGYSLPLFSSLLKKMKRRKGE